MACVSSVSYSVLVNGIPLKPFEAKKGLRQGDPMSPYLFALAMVYLSRCLASLRNKKGFSYHPKCRRTETVGLLFADDLLIFCKGDRNSIVAVKE